MGLDVMDLRSNSRCALFDEFFVMKASKLCRVTGSCKRVVSIKVGENKRMCVVMSANKATMNDNVSKLGATMGQLLTL